MSASARYRHSPTLSLVALGFVACSFQDFGYLQQGALDSTSAGGSTSLGGVSGSAGDPNTSTVDSGGNSSSNGGAGGSTSSTTTTASAGGNTSVSTTATSNTANTASTTTSTGGTSTTETSTETSTSGGGEAGAPTTGPINLLTNASFEAWQGWIVDPASSQGVHANIKWPQPGSTTPDGETMQNLLGTWHATDAYALDIYQALDGLEDGSYTFKGYFNWGGAHNLLQLFSRNCGGLDLTQEIPITGDTVWVEVGIGGIEVSGGHCEVGFRVDSHANTDWLNADLFSFVMDPQ